MLFSGVANTVPKDQYTVVEGDTEVVFVGADILTSDDGDDNWHVHGETYTACAWGDVARTQGIKARVDIPEIRRDELEQAETNRLISRRTEELLKKRPDALVTNENGYVALIRKFRDIHRIVPYLFDVANHEDRLRILMRLELREVSAR